MICSNRNRSHLLLGCGSAALALALTFAPQRAEAQAVNANGTVTAGVAFIDNPAAGQTNVDIVTPTAVIDWQPVVDNAGNALIFLPANNTLQFQSSQLPTFAVLNRILPDANNNIAVINGNVISRVTNPATGAQQAGGTVAFYSPSGLLIGGTATFDVGSLLLTTLDVSPSDFENFATFGGNMTLAAAPGSTARVQINSGAQILATPENAFFAVVAADIEMRGTALVNGSHAFVAGEVVNLSFSNGLFNISVPVGTAASGEVVTVDGTVGGPSSTGITGDNHMIYGVAHAQNDPISMLFRGNLGFDPAQSAGIVNGEIILAANYNVFERQVDTGSISEGIGAIFRDVSATSDIRADVILEDFSASSSVLAIGTGQTIARGNSSVDGNLLLVGRDVAALDVTGDNLFEISGDVLIDARDYGVVSSSLQTLDAINATGGTARILSEAGATVLIGGNVLVSAEATPGQDDLNRIAGTAQGGTAILRAAGGSVVIAGDATFSANARQTDDPNILVGAVSRGGTARVTATLGGSAVFNGGLGVTATAAGSGNDGSSPATASSAFGGTAQVLIDGLGTITVDQGLSVSAGAFVETTNAINGGGVADAGEASIVADGNNVITIGGDVFISATAGGRDNFGGQGTLALGGVARAVTSNGGRINIAGSFFATAEARAGDGTNGGDAFGGIAGANAITGTIGIALGATVNAQAFGGDARFGFGGSGGLARGGNAFLQANGTASQAALLTVGEGADIRASGFGGRGGDSDGATIDGGRGGDGYGGEITTPNQADPNFGSGAFLLAGGDYGRISVAGTADVLAQGAAGTGGARAGQLAAGQGGNGFGGLAQAGLALLGGPGTVGGGLASFADLFVNAVGFGGQGGIEFDDAVGVGGIGTGGAAFLTLRSGTVTAGQVLVTASGFGGAGNNGGNAFGGEAGVIGSLGGSLTATGLNVFARATAGDSQFGRGGDALGGLTAVEGDGVTITINGDATIDASATGGGGLDFGSGGNGTGGEAYIAFTVAGAPDTITVTGHAQVFADGVGGFTNGAFAAGNGLGGLARIEAQGGGDIALGSTQVTAIGQGGFASIHEGGDGTGGIVRLRASGGGSTLNILRNVPQNQTETRGGVTMLNANGVGEGARGGSGIGGLGGGGTLEVLAALGGAMTLPTNVAADPNAAFPAMQFVARGFGGTSEVDGGVGGAASGGNGLIEVDGTGSTIIMGETVFSVYGEGGSSTLSTSNVTGGAGFGGTRRIRVLNGGSASLQMFGGTTGGVGGNGSGTGDGGDGFGGRNFLELVSGTLNVAGDLMLVDEATGGSGANGGDALGGIGGEGGGIVLTVTGSTINLLPGGNSTGRIVIGGSTRGGLGSTLGGFARSSAVAVNLSGSTVNGGAFQIESIASGGQATNPDGIGGNGLGGTIAVNFTGSTLNLSGATLIADTVFGGTGGLSGQGGNATSAPVEVLATNSTITLLTNQVGVPGALRVFSRTVGGLGGTVGNAISGRAALGLTDSAMIASGVTVSSDASAGGQSGQTGGIATAGQALLVINGAGSLDADLIEVVGNAVTSAGGSSQAGSVMFELAAGSTATVTANQMFLAANALGADPGDLANGAGVFAANIFGGNVTLGSLQASALGDVIPDDQAASTLAAVGGNLNVTGALNANALGSIAITTGQGGIIGTPASGSTTTAITISARGDIIVDDDDSGLVGLSGRSISLAAGGSILLDGNMATANGPISIAANNGLAFPLPTGVTSVADITMTAGTFINAGSGAVTISMGDGGGVAGRLSGAITLANITGGLIDVRNFGADAGSDITVLGSGVLTASGSGRAIDLASLNGEVINLHGDAGLILTGGGHYGIFAATPTGSQIGSFANYARRYNVADAAAYDALNPGGNFAAFRIVPFLTVTADDITRFYGNVTPGLTASFAGFLPGDSIVDLLGAPELTTLANATSGVGLYAINLALGTLLSEQGYQFSLGSGPGQLTIIPRPITVTANNLSRFYGNANPALTFSVGGLGLVNGDQLSGALSAAANATTGVGSVAITQGTLAASANYTLTFVNGALTITPRPIIITADNLAKFAGQPDPALTFTLGGDGLVNGDQLTGALAREAGEALRNFAIGIGSLTAGPNYLVTFVAGHLTINAPPAPPEVNNPISLDPAVTPGDPTPSATDEEEARFGIDFPEQPDAPLIEEEELLDEPVTSGGDPTLYSTGVTPPAGSQ